MLRRLILIWAVSMVGLAATAISVAQVVNPATEQEKPEEGKVEPGRRLRTWELPAVEVVAGRPLKEEERIGPYRQPRWASRRLFSTVRIYVRPKGYFQIEHWFIPEVSRDGEWEAVSMYELEMGLGHRIQFDLYFVTEQKGIDGPIEVKELAPEIRWALADWGKIPGNPTLYLEWEWKSGGQPVIEPKLLLGGELASRWHWGLNLICEQTVGGEEMEREIAATLGISYTVIDQKLSVGGEIKAEVEFEEEEEGEVEKEFELLIGPSMRWFPIPEAHIDFAPLFGLTEEPLMKAYVIIGWEF